MSPVPWKASALIGCLTILLIFSGQALSQESTEDCVEASDGNRFSLVENLFGKAVKAVVYGGLSFASFASPVLCPLLSYETEKDNTKQPTLFVFNNARQFNRSIRIFADDEITAGLVNYAEFDPTQLTLIYVHGWLGGINRETFLRDAKNVALGAQANAASCKEPTNSTIDRRASRVARNANPNVIIVDWTKFAEGSLYTSTQNTYKVSLRLARMLKQLSQVGGLKPELMHCLGHSLGAHICGQAARKAFAGQSSWTNNGDTAAASMRSLSRMGRITGLDPGGFCYEIGLKDEASYTGLKTADALLVDAIVTNRAPFGNKLNVAQYNVRINNGFSQPPCSLWLHPELGSKYFRDAISLVLGNAIDAQTVACDHYFSTRFAYQHLPATCSYVGYACDSYGDFLRGRCGQCSNAQQCYTMDFEYQRPSPSEAHYVEQVSTHSSYFNDFHGAGQPNPGLIGGANQAGVPIGSVPYEQRRVYHLRTANEAPYCSMLFRVRVHLSDALDMSSFKTNQLKLRFAGSSGRILNVSCAANEELVSSIGLHGPWESADQSNPGLGLGSRTLTALFDLNHEYATSLASLSADSSPIKEVVVVYDLGIHLLGHADPANPVESIDIDFLSASEQRLRAKYSRSFKPGQFKVVYKYLGATVRVKVR